MTLYLGITKSSDYYQPKAWPRNCSRLGQDVGSTLAGCNLWANFLKLKHSGLGQDVAW